MSEKNICPGCGRHCDLDMPHCSRGEEYRRTGELPVKQHEGQHCYEMYSEHVRSTDINEKLIISIRDLSHMMRFLYEGKASQRRILIILSESESITQRDLTERLGIQPGSASEILSKLESAGLIIRTQNETDRRTTDVRLTDSGRELAREALAQRQKRHEEMFSCLLEEERQQLLSLLERICIDWRTRYSESRNAHRHERHHGHQCGHGHHDGHRHQGGMHGHGGN